MASQDSHGLWWHGPALPRMWAFSKGTKLTYKRIFDAHIKWKPRPLAEVRRDFRKKDGKQKRTDSEECGRLASAEEVCQPQATLLITLIPIVKLNLSPKILWTRKWMGRDRVVFMVQSSSSRGIWTDQCFLLTYSNVPLDSSDAGVVLESFPDLEFQRAGIHEVGSTELAHRSRPTSCLGWQQAADTQVVAFRDSVSLFPPHDPCWLHSVNHLIQMTPKYTCHVELGVSFSEDRLNPEITHYHFPITF